MAEKGDDDRDSITGFCLINRNHIFAETLHDLADDFQSIPTIFSWVLFLLKSLGHGIFTAENKMAGFTVKIKPDIRGFGGGSSVYGIVHDIDNETAKLGV